MAAIVLAAFQDWAVVVIIHYRQPICPSLRTAHTEGLPSFFLPFLFPGLGLYLCHIGRRLGWIGRRAFTWAVHEALDAEAVAEHGDVGKTTEDMKVGQLRSSVGWPFLLFLLFPHAALFGSGATAKQIYPSLLLDVHRVQSR